MTNIVSLSECCEFIRDSTHGSPARTPNGIPVLSAAHVRDGRLHFDTDRFTSQQELETFQKRLKPSCGDVLLTIVGTIGRTAIVIRDRPLVFQRSVCVLRPKNNAVIPLYLRLVLESEAVKSQFLVEKHEVAQAGIYLEALNEIKIPLPSVPEQQRISQLLDRADQLRRTRRYALELTDTFLLAAFLEFFGCARDLRWDTSTLGELTLDFTYGTSTKCSDNSALHPVLRIPNVIQGAIDTTNLKFGELSPNEQKKLRLAHGDLLFVRTNGNPDYVGRCAVFDLEAELYFASYLIRARTKQKLIVPVFLSAYLRTPDGRRSMQPSIRTTAGQYNVSVEGLRDVQVIVPPLPLQQKFAALVQRVERLRAVQREALRQAEHLFASLLHRAFSC